MRNWLPLCFACFTAAVIAAPVQAQYIYVDVNGDEYCDPADGLSIGQGQVDVWVDTAYDGMGNPVTCSTGEELTISGYQVVLRNDTGADIAWANARPEFPVLLGFVWEKPYTYAGYTSPGSSTHLAPGRYKLGTLSVTSAGQCPWMGTMASATFSVGTRLTEFSSQCPGAGGDYRLRLGVDFTDPCGSSVICDPPYPPPLDSSSTTWGKIKKQYMDR